MKSKNTWAFIVLGLILVGSLYYQYHKFESIHLEQIRIERDKEIKDSLNAVEALKQQQLLEQQRIEYNQLQEARKSPQDKAIENINTALQTYNGQGMNFSAGESCKKTDDIGGISLSGIDYSDNRGTLAFTLGEVRLEYSTITVDKGFFSYGETKQVIVVTCKKEVYNSEKGYDTSVECIRFNRSSVAVGHIEVFNETHANLIIKALRKYQKTL